MDTTTSLDQPANPSPAPAAGHTIQGDWVQGDKVQGDKIVTGAISNSNNIAIGKNIQQTVNNGVASSDLAALFAPLYELVDKLDDAQQTAAKQAVQALQDEAAKGSAADDSRMGRIVDRLVDLVPNAVTAVVSTFASPILAALTGPVTKFVLEKIQKK